MFSKKWSYYKLATVVAAGRKSENLAMRRLQRRVRDSDQSAVPVNVSASRALTFDRRTFTECSNRMKRLVPTLNRRSDNLSAPIGKLSEDGNLKESTICATCEIDNQIDEIVFPTPVKCSPTKNELCSDKQVVNRNHSSSASSKGVTTQSQPGNASSTQENARFVSTTLPRNILASTVLTPRKLDPSSATLPSSFSALTEKSNRKRRSWLKPLKTLVTFMSNIGDNIDITSYPTP